MSVASARVHEAAGGRDVGRLVLWGIVVVSCAFCALAVWPSDYAQDDWLYFVLERQTPFREWLGSVYFQHWAPGYRLTFWVLQQVGVEHYWIPLVAQLALLVAMLLLLDDLLRRLAGGRRWWTLALVALAGTSIYLPRFMTWPAAGLQLMPTYVVLLAGLGAYLRFRADGRLRWCDLTALLVAVGLCFYERPLLLPVYALLLRVLVLEPSRSPRVHLRGLWAERRWWIAAIVPGVVFLAFYWLTNVGGGGTSGTPSGTALGQFARIVWLRGFFPELLGVQVPGTNPGRLADASVVVVQLLLLALVVWTLVRRPAAWRAWAFFLVAGGVSVLIAAYGRLTALGSGIGFDPRYLAELLVLFPVALTVAIAGPMGEAGRIRRWSPALGERGRRIGLGVVAALGVAHVVLALDQASDYQRGWFGTEAKRYFDRVDDGLARLGPRPALADGLVPGAVQTPSPFARTSSIVGLRVPGARWDVAPDDLHAIDETGAVRPARIRPLLAGNAEDLSPAGAHVASDGVICQVGAAGELLLTLTPRTPVVADAPLYARVVGAGPAPPGQATVFAAPVGGDYPTASDRYAHLGADVAGLASLEVTSLSRIRVDLPAGSSACVRRVEVGTLAFGR